MDVEICKLNDTRQLTAVCRFNNGHKLLTAYSKGRTRFDMTARHHDNHIRLIVAPSATPTRACKTMPIVRIRPQRLILRWYMHRAYRRDCSVNQCMMPCRYALRACGLAPNAYRRNARNPGMTDATTENGELTDA